MLEQLGLVARACTSSTQEVEAVGIADLGAA